MGTRAAPRQPSGIELRWHGDPVSFLPPRLCATVSCFKNTVTIPSLRANRKDLGSCCCLSLVNHLSLTHLSLAFKEGWEYTDFRSLYNQGQLCLFFWSQTKWNFVANLQRGKARPVLQVHTIPQTQRFLRLEGRPIYYQVKDWSHFRF